jgi:diguanylate cyclase (GGDEF)-like protein
MQGELTSERSVFLSIERAGRREVRLAQAAVLVSLVVFLAVAPYAKTPLAQVPAFVPIYVSAFVICDLITTVLLFVQFNFLRSRALFVLASGYLFTTFMGVAYGITFGGLFSPTGLLRAGPQTTAWMYMFWHGGFPLVVIAYALVKDEGVEEIVTGGRPRGNAGIAILSSVAAVLAAVCLLTFFATAGHEYLPTLMRGNQHLTAFVIAASSTWALSLVALAMLWWRRRRTVIDLWLMVVMGAWLFDIALAVVLNAGRYDLGYYAGRIYGLLAASFLLIVLLTENGKHFARLVRLSAKLNTANNALERLSMQDGLTDLANRRCFDTYLAGQTAIARRNKRALALVLCDVDSFKAYNDHYGHQAGDECLKQVAAALRSCCRRPADLAARYGGEEFAMILPETELAGAAHIAEAARGAVAQLRIPHAHSIAAPHVTISGGVAVLPGSMDLSVAQLIAAADQTLYEAKNLGRNRIVSVQAEPGTDVPEPPSSLVRGA